MLSLLIGLENAGFRKYRTHARNNCCYSYKPFVNAPISGGRDLCCYELFYVNERFLQWVIHQTLCTYGQYRRARYLLSWIVPCPLKVYSMMNLIIYNSYYLIFIACCYGLIYINEIFLQLTPLIACLCVNNSVNHQTISRGRDFCCYELFYVNERSIRWWFKLWLEH